MILQMRTSAWLATAGLLAACDHEASTPVVASRMPEAPQVPAIPSLQAPPQYLVGDPARPSALTLMPLGPDEGGVIIEGSGSRCDPEPRAPHVTSQTPRFSQAGASQRAWAGGSCSGPGARCTRARPSRGCSARSWPSRPR